MKDVTGRDFTVLDHVAVAVNHNTLKLGTVEIISPASKMLRLRWDENHKLSGYMQYQGATRWLKL